MFSHEESLLGLLPVYAKSSSGVLIYCGRLHRLRDVRNDSNVRGRELTLAFEFCTFRTSANDVMHSLTAETVAFTIATIVLDLGLSADLRKGYWTAQGIALLNPKSQRFRCSQQSFLDVTSSDYLIRLCQDPLQAGDDWLRGCST